MPALLKFIGLVLGVAYATAPCWAQHPWQQPKPLIPLADVQKIIGPLETDTPSKPRHLLWVWGYDKDHGPGAHDYERVRELFCGLL